MTELRLSKDLSLPVDVVTETIGLVAQRGAGKTYATRVLLEELVGAGLPVCVLDPMGVYWGARSSADGKGEGLPIVILGGDHADVPLEPASGSVVADWISSERRSCILDVSGFRKGEQRRFVMEFAEQLYRKNREPLHVILDEADLWAPQRPGPEEARMLGAIEDLVRRGRARGIGLSLVTQRPAVINKDVLTQVSALIALRITGPQDRKAIEEWIRYHGDGTERDQVLASLASLPIGTAWFWSPGWLGMLRKIRIRQLRTFDSSSTPKAGAKRVVPKKLAPVDIEALKGRIAETLERARSEDPKSLRARIAELELQIKKQPLADAAFDTNAFSRMAMRIVAEAEQTLDAAARAKSAIENQLGAYRDAISPPRGTGPAIAVRQVSAEQSPASLKTTTPASDLGKGELTILTAIAQHRLGASREQLTVLTGYKRSSRDTYLQRLRAAGLTVEMSGIIVATLAGRAALPPDFQPLPTGAALRQHWLDHLPKGERAVLEVLVSSYPQFVSREALTKSTGYQRSSRDTYLQRLRSRQLVVTSGTGARAAETLF